MIFRPASYTLFAVSLVCVLLGLAVCCAHAAEKQKGRPIEFSEPRNLEITTNLTQLPSKKDTLKELEEDLSLHLRSLTPKSSLDGVMAPPVQPHAPPVMPNKKAKELLERRKYWYLMNPDDLSAAPTTEEIFKVPELDKNGEEKKSKSPIDRFFERQHKGEGWAEKSKDKDSSSRNRFKSREQQEEDDLPESVARSAKSLKQIAESNSTARVLSPLSRPDTFANIFGLENNRPPEPTAAQKARLEEFKQLLNYSPTSTSGSVADQYNSLAGVRDWRTESLGGLDPLATSLQKEGIKPLTSPITAPALANPVTSFSPPVALSGLAGATPKVFTPAGAPGAPLSTLRVDPPKPSAPLPVFSVPQRKF